MSTRLRFTLGLSAVAVGAFVMFDGWIVKDIVPVLMGLALSGLGAMWTLGLVGEA